MKKIIAFIGIFILAFFMIESAEDYQDYPGAGKRTADLRQEAEDSMSDATEKITEEARSIKRTVLERREVVGKRITAQINEARKKAFEAKEEYKTIREDYIEKKRELSESKTNYRECLSSGTEECKRTVRQVKINAKEHLINSADLIIKNLEELKSKIQSSTELSEEEINKLVASIEEEIRKITEAKSVLENINEDTSREDIQEAAKTIKEAWKNAKVNAYKARLMHVGYSMENLISKANVIGDRVQ